MDRRRKVELFEEIHRHFVGIELSKCYFDLAEQRLRQPALRAHVEN